MSKPRGKRLRSFMGDIVYYGLSLGIICLVLAFVAWALRLAYSNVFGG